ncbi:MAG: ABC transporter permease [Rhodobacter sp.]|nr:ABC transporter permease [Rhodobacter sp.]
MNGRLGGFGWQALGIFALLLLWVFLPGDGDLIPNLGDIARKAGALIESGDLGRHLLQSVSRVLAGILIAVVLALVFCLIGFHPAFRGILQGPIEIMRPVPPIAWIPVVILLFGPGGNAAIAIVTLAALFPIVTSVFAAWDGIDETYVLMAKTLGVERWKLFQRVYVPLLLEGFLIGFRMAFGLAWFSVVASEMVGSSGGLGYGIQVSSLNLEMERFFVYLLTIALCGFAMNWLVIAVFQYACPWQKSGQAHV